MNQCDTKPIARVGAIAPFTENDVEIGSRLTQMPDSPMHPVCRYAWATFLMDHAPDAAAFVATTFTMAAAFADRFYFEGGEGGFGGHNFGHNLTDDGFPP